MERLIVFLLLLAMVAPALAQPPTVIGVGGRITVNGSPIEDGTTVIVKNNNTGVYDNATTENGWYASSMSAKDGDVISIMVYYSGKNYWNNTVVDTLHITQFCNISITIESNLIADAGGYYYGNEGETIILDASGSTGNITSYTWECNGIIKHGVTASYIFDDGDYIATLTVSDGTNQDTDNAVITISNVPPVADAGDMYFGNTGEEIVFDGSDSSDVYDDLLYRWDFDGDGIWDTGWGDSHASHVYTMAGIYTIILNVTDGDAYDIDTALAVISGSNNEIPVANFTYNIDNLTVSFIDKSYDDGYIVNWTWNFGDGNTSYEQNPTHQYAEDGTYNITLRVMDDEDAVDYETKEITLVSDIEVNLRPVANFTVEGVLIANHTVYLNSTSYDPDGYITNSTWMINGNVLYNESIEMKFSAGTHNITLTVKDDDNANDSITRTITIEGVSNFYNLTIYVTHDGSPIQGVKITTSDITAWTGDDGKVVLSLERGWHTILIEKDGYQGKSEQVHLTGDKTINVTLNESRNTPLSPIIVIIAIFIALWRKYEAN